MKFESGDYILRDTSWSFGIDNFKDSSEFVKEFINYNESVNKVEFKTTVVYPFPKIIIIYCPLIIVTKRFTLKAKDKKGFTNLELMYGVNFKMAQRLKHSDRRFFEGLRYVKTTKRGTHIFQIEIGS